MFPKIPKEWRHYDNSVTLEHLNDQLAELHILSIVTIVIFMVIGVVGNILSIYVFTTRYESSTHRYFILWMAWIDLISSAVGKPLLLVSMFYPYMFPSEHLCKTGRFLHIGLVVSSGLIVVAIATERHRRICSPFSLELTTKKTLVICILATAFGILMAIPAIELYGEAEVETGIPNITGKECFVEPSYEDTVYPKMYFFAQLVLAFGCIIIISILYLRTVATLWFHLKFRKENTYAKKKPYKNGKEKLKKDGDKKKMDTLKVENDVCHSISTRSDGIVIINSPGHLDLSKPYIEESKTHKSVEQEEVMPSIPEDESDECFITTEDVTLNVPANETENNVENNIGKKEGVRINVHEVEVEGKMMTTESHHAGIAKHNRGTSVRVRRQSTKHRIESSSRDESDKSDGQSLATKQVTMMFFLITLVFVISFLPHLFLLITVVLYSDFLQSMSPTGIVFYTLFLRSFVINNMANPIIYAFCDKRFRSECADAVMVVFTCGRYLDWTK